MITTSCFSICGYFNYPVIGNTPLLNFIKRFCDVAHNDVRIEYITANKSKINHVLLFESGDYSSDYGSNLNLLESDVYTPLSVRFKNKYNVTSEIFIKPTDYRGFEIDYRLEEDELSCCADKDLIIQDCARIFFEIFKPLYGCCGTEMFLDEIEQLEENEVINTKFYCIGYIDFNVMDKFDFIKSKNNAEKFLIKPLQNGNMYLNKKFNRR